MTASPEKNEKKAEKSNKLWDKVAAVVLLVGVIALMVFIVVKLFGPQLKELFHLLKDGTEEEISDYLNAEGQWKGLLSVFVMSALQVISIFIPGIVVQVAAGVIYGWWKSFLMTYLGFIAGNVLVFTAARRLGDRLVVIFDANKKSNWLIDKINNYSPVFVLGLAYMIPGIPNGFITYMASQVDIDRKSFTQAVAVSSWIQILCNCVAGHYLIRRNVVAVVVVFGLQAAIIFLVAKNRNWFLSLGGARKKPAEKADGEDKNG